MELDDLGTTPLRAEPSVEPELGVSIIVCCHNSEGRLPPTLAHLARQKISAEIRWEVLVIDNASTDRTGEVARQVWPKRGPAPLQVLSEPRPGKAHALARGLAAARYEFLGIIDDDNWVSEDWVAIAYSQMLAHPDVGIVGSAGRPVFEVSPPAWFRHAEMMYAITPTDWQAGDFTHRPGTLFGAGMVVRKSAWQWVRDLDCPELMSGRLKGSMAAGEDTELCYQLRLAGWKLWFEPRLQFQHFLPAARLRWEYVRGMYYGTGEAAARCRPYELSLDTADRRQKGRYRYSWSFMLLMAIKNLVRHPVSLASALLLRQEGNPHALRLADLTGQIRMLLRLRSKYESQVLEVQRFSARLRRGVGATPRPPVASAGKEPTNADAVPSTR